jgi:peptidyl-prolyl cis-trans isomerase C
MIRQTLIFPILFLAILNCTGLAQQNSSAAPPDLSAKKSETSNLVVARVSGQPITEKDILDAIDQLASQRRIPVDQAQQRNFLLFKDAMDNLVVLSLLKAQALQQNITAEQAAIDQQLQQISQRYPSKEAFEKDLASQEATIDELKKDLEENLIIQKTIDLAIKDAPGATEEDIRKFYDDNLAKFEMPEQVRAAHILLTADSKSTPEQRGEIKKKLEGIRADIESKAITFSEAAAKYSQDKSNAQKGGDLSFFARGGMVKPFEDAAFALNPGGLSSVVETQYGYHLIQITERKPAGKAAFEEVKPKIQQFLNQAIKRNATQKYVEGLKAKATIENFMTPDAFAKRHPVK